MRAPPTLSRLCFGLAFTISSVGCFSWRPYEPAAPLSAVGKLPHRLRASLADSSRVELTAPFVRADSLYGRSGPKRDTLALSVAEIRELERERFNVWRTLGATVVAPAVALLVVFAIACDDGGCQPTY